MSGECKSYRLNEPMGWKVFLEMPDDLKITYIKLIREKYNAPGKDIAKMLGTNQNYYSREIGRLGLSLGQNCRGGQTHWDRDGFYAWAYGLPKTEDCQSVQEAVKEECPVQYTHYEVPAEAEQEVIETEATDEEAEEIPEILGEEWIFAVMEERDVRQESKAIRKAIPTTGSMTFEGKTEDILLAIAGLLEGANVLLSVKWDVVGD